MVRVCPEMEMSRSLASRPGSSALTVTLSLVSARSRRGIPPTPGKSRLGDSPKHRSNSRSISRLNMLRSPKGVHFIRAIIVPPFALADSPTTGDCLPPVCRVSPCRNPTLKRYWFRLFLQIADQDHQVLRPARPVLDVTVQDGRPLEAEVTEGNECCLLTTCQLHHQPLHLKALADLDQLLDQQAAKPFLSILRIDHQPHLPQVAGPAQPPPMQRRVPDHPPIDQCQERQDPFVVQLVHP